MHFVQARHYTPVPLGRPFDLVVIHTAETELAPGVAHAVAAWFAGPEAPRASAHYVVDPGEVVQCVHERDIAWAAPGANTDGIQIELAGRAAFGVFEWASSEAQAMLERLATLVGGICARRHIPVRRLSAKELKTGARGLCGHVDVSKAWGKSSHWDPGPLFPWDRLMDLVGAVDKAAHHQGA